MLFLGPSQSLRYHNLNPNYIHDRLKLLGQTFTLRVLLVQVDVVRLQKSLQLHHRKNIFKINKLFLIRSDI